MDWQPLFLSLQVAAAALALAMLGGVLGAFFMTARSSRFGILIEAVVLLPLVLPPVVTGYALLVLFGKNGWLGKWLQEGLQTQILFTPAAAVIASAVVALPLTYTSAKAAFSRIDPHLKEAAQCLGARGSRVFWTVELPLAWPGLAAGAILAFARALGEFGATIMVAGNIAGHTTTAPVAIYMAVEGGEFDVARNYVVVMAVMNFAFLVFLNLWSARFEGAKR